MSTPNVDMSWWTYVQTLVGTDNFVEAAGKAGFDKSAFSRWKQGAKADPAFVVKLARAYHANPIHALVISGLLTEEEAQLREVNPGSREALERLSDDELIDELRLRLRQTS